jgi:hypothetical protein
MSAETATYIQTAAAIIQAAAAAVFLYTVRWDAKRRARLAEQERRDRLVSELRQLWVQLTDINVSKKTDEVIARLEDARKTDFINKQLEARGETWKYPFERE